MDEQILWKSDLENGIYRNPILYADYSDPDVIRVENTYYMTASSFNYTPGLPILISEDLVNWKLVNYAVERIPYPAYELPQHSKGIWAPAIRYRNGWFYIYYGMPDEGIFMVRTQNPLQKWEEPKLVLEGRGLIDPCPFWEEDGRAYVVHAYAKSRIGFKSFLGIFPLSEDGTTAVGEDHLLFNGTETQVTIEGPKVYKRNGWYYIFAPAGGVKTGWQTVLRARTIHGPFEERIVLRQGDTPVNGPHQGGLVDTPFGEDWFLHFQDRGAYGRIVHLQPVHWRDDWPVIGREKKGQQWGEPYLFHAKPKAPAKASTSLISSDDFQASALGLQWQWLGNGKKEFYSLTERPGFLRLYSQNPSGIEPAVLWNCSNILTQKMVAPCFTMETKLEFGTLKNRERAGVLVIGGSYVWLGVQKENGVYRIVCKKSQEGEQGVQEVLLEEEPLSAEQTAVFFRVQVEEQETAVASFSYSIGGSTYTPIAEPFRMSSHTWVGAKTGLFAVADDLKKSGGFADFSYVTYIPNGQEPPLEFLLAQSGDFETVQHLVERSKTSMNIRDERHRTLLHYAAQSGNVEVIQYLTERVGLSPLEGDKDRITPYELAHTAGKQEAEAYFEQSCGTPLKDMYKNPIRTGMYPDPSIVRVGEDYYMVNSSFVFFPCIPVSHSKDLVHWNIIGYAITHSEWAGLEELEGGRGYWAPDISYWNGRFYITATYRMNDTGVVFRKQMITSAEKPEGPYGKPVFLDVDGIDPSLFHNDDGRHYMLVNRGAQIQELTADMTGTVGKPRLLYYGDFKRAPEGPHLLKKDGYYYLFLAEGGTGPGHRITVARSKSLQEPFEPCPYNPIMRQKDPKAAIQRCGHGKPVQTQKGDWYMVYLCGRTNTNGRTLLGRETALDPVTWTPDGWPLVNQLKGPSVLQRYPNLPRQDWEAMPEEAFSKGELSLEWMTPRAMRKDLFAFSKQGLALKGDSYDLDSLRARSILLKRQTAFTFEAETSFCFENWKEGENAGLVGYYDENTWLKFGVRFTQNAYEVFLEENRGKNRQAVPLRRLERDTGKLCVKMCTQSEHRAFFLLTDSGWESVAVREHVDYLCDEGYSYGKRFTGPTTGIYVHGGQTVLFHSFRMHAEE